VFWGAAKSLASEAHLRLEQRARDTSDAIAEASRLPAPLSLAYQPRSMVRVSSHRSRGNDGDVMALLNRSKTKATPSRALLPSSDPDGAAGWVTLCLSLVHVCFSQ
jgi:hypothetical protein